MSNDEAFDAAEYMKRFRFIRRSSPRTTTRSSRTSPSAAPSSTRTWRRFRLPRSMCRRRRIRGDHGDRAVCGRHVLIGDRRRCWRRPRAAIVMNLPTNANPPLAFEYRNVIDPFVSPRAAAALAPRIRNLVTRLTDRFIERGSVDIVKELAQPLTAMLTMWVTGLPEEKWFRYSDCIHRLLWRDGDRAQLTAEIAGVQREMAEDIARLRADPDSTGVIGASRDAQIEGRSIEPWRSRACSGCCWSRRRHDPGAHRQRHGLPRPQPRPPPADHRQARDHPRRHRGVPAVQRPGPGDAPCRGARRGGRGRAAEAGRTGALVLGRGQPGPGGVRAAQRGHLRSPRPIVT